MQQKRVLVGVTGGIAAYKSADLVRQLRKQGHEVRVMMTAGAQRFVTPLTFQALSGYPVRTDLLDEGAEAGMGHIELAKWAELVLIAPASAQVMAKLVCGLADDLLSTVCLATEAPIALAPAMNQAMWRNRRTQQNLERLQADPQFRIWGPAAGDQACGDTGFGRMLEPIELAQAVAGLGEGPLSGKKVVITAGPTRERIDPVRYISNDSSGKMGFALAVAARDAGADVTLVCGPVALETPSGVARVNAESAEQMREAVQRLIGEGCDIFVASAAVSDYRPAQREGDKIKKSRENLSLELVRNPDILSEVAAAEQGPFTVGFAAETRDVAHYAKDKLRRKKLDMIVANDVSDRRIGFESERNAVTVFWSGGEQSFAEDEKSQLGRDLVALIGERWRSTRKGANE
ncbi:bifunctional phosphopantothenoylcysteine decarboxylase/phosphopantothenate--cysteine ligase CoaBC [Marinobacteraceae bacterium S3BR75-40.1]